MREGPPGPFLRPGVGKDPGTTVGRAPAHSTRPVHPRETHPPLHPIHFPSACLSPYSSFDQNFRSVGHGVILLHGTWYTDVTSTHAEPLGFGHRNNTSPSRSCSSDVGPIVTSCNHWAFTFPTRKRGTWGCGPSGNGSSLRFNNVVLCFCCCSSGLQSPINHNGTGFYSQEWYESVGVLI